MKKELDNIIISYTNSDLLYIDELVEYIKKNSKEILNFFGIEKIRPKVTINLWNDLKKFRKFYKERKINLYKNGLAPKWVCGYVTHSGDNEYIQVLSLKKMKKTQGHEKETLEDLKKLKVMKKKL